MLRTYLSRILAMFWRPHAGNVVLLRRRLNQTLPVRNPTPTNTYGPCGCWRCRGGVAQADRPVLDRLLAKHLATQTPAAAGEFLSSWRAHPRHDASAREQLNAWLRIAAGSQEPEPAYAKVELAYD